MTTGLKRDLGLFATTAIAIGAMVGSGIFILPGLAFMEVGGPSVVLAFLFAGLLVLPAALSAAEMATAMPEDGGSYVYVERSLGPLFGTIAGIGNWFMLSFKGALALIGGAPYVVFVLPALEEVSVPVFGDPIIPLALLLATGFILLNIVSTSSTGSLQFVIVGMMIVVMAAFVLGGFPSVDGGQVDGAFSLGGSGFLAATALVFISYAGVIKISAVAEEVKDPGRVIPRAMVGALVITTVLYVVIVYVAVGLVDIPAAIEAGDLDPSGEGPIMALAAENALGTVGVAAIVAAALLALASTANAGLLSGSRFPFAMARDNLAPPRFETISERFNTPAFAVGVTGGIMLVMIAALPIDQVAKFGSAFQILVFILVNFALIGFREGTIEGYDPVFTAPLYPWVQLFGMASGFVVLSQIGTLPFVGAALITVLAIGYYYGYAGKRVDREGAAQTGVRESIGNTALERTRELFDADREYDVLVAITEETSGAARRDMSRIAADLGRLRSTVVSVVEFIDVPHRMFPGSKTVTAVDEPDWLPDDEDEMPAWYPVRGDGGEVMSAHTANEEASSGDTSSEQVAGPTKPRTAFEYRNINSEDHKRAIVDYATYEDIDLLLVERHVGSGIRQLFGDRETDWILRNAPSAVAVVEDRGFEDIEEIAVVTTRGAYDPLKLLIADAIAEETDATLNLLQALPEDVPETRRETVEEYHMELTSLCTVPVRSTILETDDTVAGLVRFVGDADLVVTGVGSTGLRARLFTHPESQLIDAVDVSAIAVQPHDTRQKSALERLLMEYLF